MPNYSHFVLSVGNFTIPMHKAEGPEYEKVIMSLMEKTGEINIVQI